ncbi:hypothetical protein VCUG_00941 [Vavraia culicis subsp. floridensis]|uniref:Uncharacterized protein n=1 Tax=Vavraia culicis (isolate floridensis) TaxID=948595 RepID=L2GWD9_VAVCU|nr:uncharacterized protein VCUG_00941 [Vavraia culicis subsp. floridensis]ELA47618.1 hypothetical protein VCUG_00941 [Vavraia culicis subsp. floridensis]
MNKIINYGAILFSSWRIMHIPFIYGLAMYAARTWLHSQIERAAHSFILYQKRVYLSQSFLYQELKSHLLRGSTLTCSNNFNRTGLKPSHIAYFILFIQMEHGLCLNPENICNLCKRMQ